MGRPNDVRPTDQPTDASVAMQGLALLALATLVVVGTIAAPAAAQTAIPADTTFRVVLQETGDATVRLTLVFPTEAATDEEALARTEANATALAAEFRDGLATVAARTAAETGREMSVSAPTAAVRAADGSGVVELGATWHGLAAIEGGELTVAAPFDDGFRPPGRFVLEAPAGYAFDAVTPAPAETTGATLAWEAGTSLDGFAVTAVPAGSAGGGSLPMPGFDVATAALALLALAGLTLLADRTRR